MLWGSLHLHCIFVGGVCFLCVGLLVDALSIQDGHSTLWKLPGPFWKLTPRQMFHGTPLRIVLEFYVNVILQGIPGQLAGSAVQRRKSRFSKKTLVTELGERQRLGSGVGGEGAYRR